MQKCANSHKNKKISRQSIGCALLIIEATGATSAHWGNKSGHEGAPCAIEKKLVKNRPRGIKNYFFARQSGFRTGTSLGWTSPVWSPESSTEKSIRFRIFDPVSIRFHEWKSGK